MICTNCRHPISDTYNLCPYCGMLVSAMEQTAIAPIDANPKVKPTPSRKGNTLILVFGLLSLLLAHTFFFSIAAIVFGAIAKSKANKKYRSEGVLSARANAGRIIGKIGFILGIIVGVYFILFCLNIMI